MTELDDVIYQLQREANEWEWLSQSAKDDEDNGLKCRFSEGSIEYKRRADEVNQMIEYLKELKTTRKALILACRELSFRDSPVDCKHVSAPRTVRYKEKFLKKAGEEE